MMVHEEARGRHKTHAQLGNGLGLIDILRRDLRAFEIAWLRDPYYCVRVNIIVYKKSSMCGPLSPTARTRGASGAPRWRCRS